MTPKEIAQLKQECPHVWEALKTNRELYYFLREHVLMRIHWTRETEAYVMTLIGPMLTVIPHTVPCGKCGSPLAHDRTLASPYNSSYRPGKSAYVMSDGWCIDCVLRGFFDPDTPLYDESADPNSPTYDAVYANNKRIMEHWYDIPEDYDGPPIVIA